MSITILIIIATVASSYMAFSNTNLVDRFIFSPTAVTYNKEWYRFFSCGLIHADIAHLAFNMLALYMFGEGVESAFAQIFGSTGKLIYLLLYVSALFVCLIPTYAKHKHDENYRSLGASGAVSAIVFAGMFLFPTIKVGIFPLPPFIPAFIFAPLYIIISFYLDKQKVGNINHSAHIWGSIYGIAFLLITSKLFTQYDLWQNFLQEVKAYIGM